MEKKKNYLSLVGKVQKAQSFEMAVLIADRSAKLASVMYILFSLLKDFQEEYEEVFTDGVSQLLDLKRQSKALEKQFDKYIDYIRKCWKFDTIQDEQACIMIKEKVDEFLRHLSTTKGWGVQGELDNYGVDQEHLINLINTINNKYKEEVKK